MSDTSAQKQTTKPRVLYVHYGENWLRGSEIVLLDLLISAKAHQYAPVLWCNNEVLANKAKTLGIEVIIDNFVCLGYWTQPRWNFLQFFKLLIKAKKLINTYNINLVHCNNGAPCQWMVPICKLTNTPILLHLHARYMFRDRLTLLFHGVDSIVGVSKTVTQLFKQGEFTHQHIEIIYNGIDPKRVVSSKPRDIRAELSAEKDDFVILYMGSLIPRKSVQQLLFAINRLTTNYKIKLVIVGSGSEEVKLTQLQLKLKLGNNVKFLPASEQVDEIYSSNVDCFISVPSEEVFGLTLAEASIAKIPVITSNIPGINEIYTHEENALLVSPSKTEELVYAIQSLIKAPQLREYLANNAHKHILNKFSVAQQFSSFSSSYLRLLNSESKQPLHTTSSHTKTILKALLAKSYQYCLLKFSWRKSHE